MTEREGGRRTSAEHGDARAALGESSHALDDWTSELAQDLIAGLAQEIGLLQALCGALQDVLFNGPPALPPPLTPPLPACPCPSSPSLRFCTMLPGYVHGPTREPGPPGLGAETPKPARPDARAIEAEALSDRPSGCIGLPPDARSKKAEALSGRPSACIGLPPDARSKKAEALSGLQAIDRIMQGLDDLGRVAQRLARTPPEGPHALAAVIRLRDLRDRLFPASRPPVADEAQKAVPGDVEIF